MIKKDSRHGFLKRVLYTYLAVLIIPLILLNFFVFRLVVDHARDLDLKYTQEYLDRNKNNLKDEVSRLELIAYDVNKSLLIRPSILERDYNKIREAQIFLSSYIVANQFISDIIYYPQDGQTLYGSGSVYSLNTYTNAFVAVPGFSSYDVFRKINGVKEKQIIKWTNSDRGEKLVNFHYMVPLDKTSDRDSSLIFLISYSNMSRLMGIDKNPPQTPVILRDEQGRIIFDYVPAGQEDHVVSYLLAPGKVNYYTPLTAYLHDPPWTLTMMVEKNEFIPSVKRAFTLTGLLSLAVLLLEFLIIRFALTFTYNPLKNLAEKLTPEESIDDVLLSLQTGVHKLQLTRESALRKLQREDFIGTLLHLRMDNDSDLLLQNKAAALGFSLEKSPMAAVIIDLGDQTLPGDSDLIDAYYETLTEILPLPFIGWFEPVTGRFFCITQTEGERKEELLLLLEDACEQLFEEFSIQGSVYPGGFKKDYFHLRDSLNEAIFSSTALSHNEKRELSYYESELTKLSEMLREGKGNMSVDLIHELYQKAPSRELTDYLTFRIFNIITRTLPDQSQDSWNKQRYPVLEGREEGEKKDFIISLARECVEILNQAGKQTVLKATLLTELDGYIKENYLNGDFSVSQMADHFNMSLSGISLLYKKQRGYGIAAHVGMARVERAKELLKEGCSVNEVVTEVGYSDTTSFIKKFKKITGQTPGEYLSSIIK